MLLLMWFVEFSLLIIIISVIEINSLKDFNNFKRDENAGKSSVDHYQRKTFQKPSQKELLTTTKNPLIAITHQEEEFEKNQPLILDRSAELDIQSQKNIKESPYIYHNIWTISTSIAIQLTSLVTMISMGIVVWLRIRYIPNNINTAVNRQSQNLLDPGSAPALLSLSPTPSIIMTQA